GAGLGLFKIAIERNQARNAGRDARWQYLDLIARAKDNGLQKMIGYVLGTNPKMLGLVSELGFEIADIDDDPDFKLVSLTV
ncbi:MAG: hypothetical protein B7Z19_04705, partial [Polynucleobacter sp. 32-46-5]